ncbi:MAG: VanW family protein [Clostridiales bacterium]|nr:VanW family protein [Clostridiales bacterium]
MEKKETEKKPEGRRLTKFNKKIIIGVVTGIVAAGSIGAIVYMSATKDNKKAPAATTPAETTTVAPSVSPAELENMKKVVDDPNFYDGITINGVSVSGKTKEEVKKQFAPDASQLIDVKFQVGDDLVPLKTDGLKLESDADAVIEEAYNYGRTSTQTGDAAIQERYATVNALKTEPKNFETTFKLGDVDVDALVHQTLDECNTELAEASVEGFDLEKLEFIIKESSNGCTVDVDKAIADVKTQFSNANYQVVIPVDADIVKPETSSDDLKEILGLVSTSTSETTDNDNRNTNIRLVCEKLDGLVLQPGDKFNFNDYIGRRTSEGGYKMAHGIYNGSMRDEIGGGICQANTMLYQSVTKANLKVDERKNHSIPSTYVDKGTDATVTWYSPNFRFTNDSEYPIAIHAYYADQKVTVEIYGRKLPDGQRIELVGEQVRTISPGTSYVSDSSLPAGTQKKVSSGRTGYVYKSYKVWYDKDGNEIKKEDYFPSTYPARSAIIHVGTGGGGGTVDPNTGTVTPDTTPDPNAGNDTPTPPSSNDTPTTPPPENGGGSGSGSEGGSGSGSEGGSGSGGSESGGGSEGGSGGGSEGGSGGGSEGGSGSGGGSEGGSGGGGSEGGGSEGGSGGGEGGSGA